MSSPEVVARRAFVYRDVALAAICGPLRFVVPIAGYAVLYPLILHQSGLQVLGLWSLLVTTSTYVGLGDVGFSQVLIREVGLDRTREELDEAYRDSVAARRAYVLLVGLTIFVIGVVALVFGAQIEPRIPYPSGPFLFSALLVVLAQGVVLSSRLHAAVLAARAENAIVQLVGAAVPVVTFGCAIIGAHSGRPLEGFALGVLGSAVLQLLFFRFRISRHHSSWHQRVHLSLRHTPRRIASLARRGGHFYWISVGFLARDPILRWVVASATGLVGVAVYDVALRVTSTLRELTAVGFSSLYPSIVTFERGGDRDATVQLTRTALIVLIGVGGLTLGLVFALPIPLFAAWLGTTPDGLVEAARLLALWNLMTIVNVPFWYLLQATHHERLGAVSLWAHSLSVLLLLPLQGLSDWSLSAVLTYWLGAAVITQVLIYYYVQSRLRLFLPIVGARRVLILLSAVIVFLSIVVAVPAISSGGLGQSLDASYALAVYLGFAAFIAIALFRPIRDIMGVSAAGVKHAHV